LYEEIENLAFVIHRTPKPELLAANDHGHLIEMPARGHCQSNFLRPPFAMVAQAMRNPFRYFNSSPEVIRLVVMMYVRYPLSLRNVEDLLAERGIEISHETVRFWWNRFGPMFAAGIRKRRVGHMRGFIQWRWHLMRSS
jgi:hypothetical protein